MENSFTQSWIQALTASAENPNARKVKPHIDLVNRLVRNPDLEDRGAAAQELWDFASDHHLLETLKLLPAMQTKWEFERDDTFVFSQPEPASIDNFEAWSQRLGIEPHTFSLVAEVNGTEWATLIREQAVQKQQAYAQTTLGNQTLQLPCSATWEGSSWKIQFESPDWFTVAYEDSGTVDRPDLASLREDAILALVNAETALLREKTIPNGVELQHPWTSCIGELAELHDSVLQSADLSQRTKLIWCCVWPTVYREENKLGGKADLAWLRAQMADCLKSSPKLTLWMFVFAKLMIQVHIGYGLGFCADFGLD